MKSKRNDGIEDRIVDSYNRQYTMSRHQLLFATVAASNFRKSSVEDITQMDIVMLL